MGENEKQFEEFIKDISFDERIDYNHKNNLEKQLKNSLAEPQSRQRILWSTIMKTQKTKFATAAAIILLVFGVIFLNKSTAPVWAIEQSIEALKDFRAVYVEGILPSGTAEIWMRANKSGTQSNDVVVRLSHGAIAWVKDGSTYYYEPGQNTVYFENALTIGLSQWLGPELLAMLSKADGAEVMRGKDPATGRERATLMCSLIDNNGPQSWIIEFDVTTKLPVSFKSWQNLDRSDQPAFYAFKIIYYEELDDSVFDVKIPGNPVYVEKPLTIPEGNIGLLGNPGDGISAEGLTQQQACEKILRENYMAIIEGDLDKIKKLCPLSKNWGDELLRAVILRTDKEDRIVEIIKVGQIFKTGDTKIGQIVAVPTILKLKNGKKVEEKMIIQFRNIGGKSSCVVHGPYGLPREIE